MTEYYCICGRNKINIRPYSALLIQQFFLLIADTHPLYLLCDECGSDILKNYKDTYGIGV
jgi:hypothetical protein